MSPPNPVGGPTTWPIILSPSTKRRRAIWPSGSALIRALVHAAPVLLLDEPTAALDQDSIGKVEAVLRERLAAGAILILVTHDPAQAERLATQRLNMVSGRLEPVA